MRKLFQMLPISRGTFALMALIQSAICQTTTTGEITGSVVDPAGKAIGGAVVQLKSIDTGDSRTVQSNSSGVYRFALIKPGPYEISGKSQDLRSASGSLVVAVGQVQVWNLHLQLQDVKTTVLVTNPAPLLNQDNANLVYTLSTRQLELLPLPGGDSVGVAYSAPGVVVNTNRSGSGNLTFQGLGSVSNLFTFNGVDDMDPYLNTNNSGTTGLLLGANEVREASVVQNAFEGQYGRQSGAQVNYVTKSGSNSYHGNLAYGYNGTLLNANDFFANKTGTPRSLAVSNQYAAALGGPVVKNKLFFFADTEGLRYALPVPNHVATIPSPALQSYTLSSIQPSQVSFYQRIFDLYNKAPGAEGAVAVTNGNSPLQDKQGKMGCGRLTGSSTNTGGIFGVNVSCTQAWETNASTATSEWLLSTRTDYNLSADQRVFFRFKTDQGYLPYLPSDISPLFDVISRQPDYEGQVNHTFVPTPHFANNFIGSVTYNDYVFDVPSLAAALQVLPVRVQINDGGSNGGFIAGVGPAAAYPQGRRAGQFQIVDDISYNHGRHFFKAGVNYRYNPESDLGYAGFVSVGKFTLRRMDEFTAGALPGQPSGFFAQNFTANPVHYLRLYNFGIYIQDQWAVSAHWKVIAAIRLERTGNPYCMNRCFATFAEPFPDLDKGLSIPYNESIRAGQAHAFDSIEPIVPEPRFSAVYSPGWLPGTVLRGGAGLFSDLYPAYFAGQLGTNPPNTFFSMVATGLINTSGTGSAPAIAAASAKAFASGFGAGTTLGELQEAVAPAPFSPPQYVYSMPSRVYSPKSLQWSFEVEHEFSTGNLIAIRYTGNHGYDIFVTNPNVNASGDRSLYPSGFGSLPVATPDPRFGVVLQLTNSGWSNYQSLTASFRRTFRRGLEGRISYSWSHALDIVSNGGVVSYSGTAIGEQIDPANLRSLNYSNADYDVRHNITGDLIWEVPWKLRNQLIDTIFGRWSVGVKLSAHTGTPFSVKNGGLFPSTSFGGTILADVLDPAVPTACGRSAVDTPCFTANQFAAAQTDFGNLPRNSFRGPGFFDMDSTLFKTAVRRERMRITLGASAYNLLNHPNFASPNGDISASGLGLITSTAINPSGPYGRYGGPSGRALVVMGRVQF